MLKKGIHQFSYSSGLISSDDNGDIKYDKSDKGVQFNLFHNLGITKKYTAGVFSKYSKDLQIYGLNQITAASFGNYRFESAFSNISGHKQGYSNTITYSYLRHQNKNTNQYEIALKHQYFSRYFALNESLLPDNVHRNIFHIGIRSKLFEKVSFSLSHQYSLSSQSDTIDLKNFSIGFYASPIKNLSSTLNFKRKLLTNNKWTNTVSIFLNYHFGGAKHAITTYYNSTSKASQSSLKSRYTPQSAAVLVDTNIQNSDTSSSVENRIDYKHHRIELFSLLKATNYKSAFEQENLYNGTIGSSFAISYTSGDFALSRPINQSFRNLGFP